MRFVAVSVADLIEREKKKKSLSEFVTDTSSSALRAEESRSFVIDFLLATRGTAAKTLRKT